MHYRLLQRMRDAVAGEDGDALRQAAHSLKSSSANLGATQLATLSKELEHRGRDRRLEGAAELLQAFEAHYLRVRDALTCELQLGCQDPGPREISCGLAAGGFKDGRPTTAGAEPEK
jgi:HPt (histidine-containing phosphotransfer) domain-containing protein